MQRGEISSERLYTFSGQRRTLVEEYYASIDWTNRRDVQKFLKALSNFLTLYAQEENHRFRRLIQQEGLIIEGNTVSYASTVSLGINAKNLIFAANGPKPEIVLVDVLNNDIKIVRNKEDRRLKLAGYEIYRFGGYELHGTNGQNILLEFFQELFHLHSVDIVYDF